MNKISSRSIFIIFVFILTACAGTPVQTPQPETPPVVETEKEKTDMPVPPETLTLTFAGDIMAHTPNFSMSDYSLIYKDIEQILKNDDLSFCNLETPVHPGRPYENYPTFNVQPPYAEAAVNAGFDVFSLANNHTNDQGLEGIQETAAYFATLEPRDVYAAGIKDEGSEELSFQLIQKNGWKILFVAVTEILNSPLYTDRFDYVVPTRQARQEFGQQLSALRKQNPCDVFVVSIHTCEDEYVHEITDVRREYYELLLDSGVDIIWANHPHLAKEWEIVTRSSQTAEKTVPRLEIEQTAAADITGAKSDSSAGMHQPAAVPENTPAEAPAGGQQTATPDKNRTDAAETGTTADTVPVSEQPAPTALIMYALGNTISGQRYAPSFHAPETNRDYTGDGYLIQVRLEKPAGTLPPQMQQDGAYTPGYRITRVTPYLITTYIDDRDNYIIKLLDDSFIRELQESGNTQWANYLSARKTLMENIKGIYTVK